MTATDRNEAKSSGSDLAAIRAAAERLNEPMMKRLRACSWDRSPNWDGRITIYPPEARGLIALIDAIRPRPTATINCAGNGGRSGTVHRAVEQDAAKTRYLFPVCPGGGRSAAGSVYEVTGRPVSCAACLDALAGNSA